MTRGGDAGPAGRGRSTRTARPGDDAARTGSAADGDHHDAARLLAALLAPGALTVALQPMVSLVDGSVVAYEALARSAAVPGVPDQWLEAAATLGRRADLELACLEAAGRVGAPPGGAPLSVNVSPSVVVDPRLPQVLAGLPRHALEITEHHAVADYDALRTTLDRLRATGTLVAVDDVGAGYASMAHVLALTPTFVKIDRSLVHGVHADPGRRALVQALQAFTAAIGGLSVAEGVEDLADLRALRAIGVDLVQGFGVAPPDGPWPVLGPAALRVLRPGADDPLPSGAGDAQALEAALAAATTQAQACDVVAAHIAAVGGLLPTVYLERGGVLRCQARRGQWLLLDGLHPGVGITGLAYAEEREVAVEDVTADPRYRAAAPGVRAEIAVPLRSAGRVVGVCNVDTVIPLTSAVRALVRRCVAQLEDRLDRLSIGPDTSVALHELSRVTPALMACDEPEALMSTVLTGVRDLVGFTSGCLWHVADGSVGAAVGPAGRALAMLPPGRVPELAALLTGVSSGVAGGWGASLAFAATDALRDLGARGVLLIPIRDRQRLTDLLVVLSPTRSTVEPDLLVAAEQLCLLAGSRLAALREQALVRRRVRFPSARPPQDLSAALRPGAPVEPGEVPAPRAAAGPPSEPGADGPIPDARAVPLPRTAAGYPARTPGAALAAGTLAAGTSAPVDPPAPAAALLPAVLSALEATSTAVTVLPDAGPLAVLLGAVEAELRSGSPERAVDRARVLRPVVEAAGDRVTAWQLGHLEALGLLEAGGVAEALDVAQAWALELTGASRAWRSTALALVAEASALLGAPADALDALSEADWLLGEVRAGASGHLTAALGVVRATRTCALYERADAVLRTVAPTSAPERDLLAARERALVALEWLTMLRLAGRDEEAAALAPGAVGRALRVQALAREARDAPAEARGLVLEAAGWLAHGEPLLAQAAARSAVAGHEPRPGHPETVVLDLVLGTTALGAGRSDEAARHLVAAVRTADDSGRSVWATAARAGLAQVESARDAAAAAAMWREVATSTLALGWAERGARLAAMEARGQVRALTASAEGHGRASEEDPLTGLGNRRLLRRVAHGMAPEAVVFVDVDRFKAVNDRYSHAVGDRVLQALGRILRATSRVGDLLVRYGGDEFVVVPHGGADAARRLAHRVRAGVEAFDWDAIAPGLELTVSVGLGTGGAGADGVLAADEAMLRAKRAGRNQVVEAPTTTQRPDESC